MPLPERTPARPAAGPPIGTLERDAKPLGGRLFPTVAEMRTALPGFLFVVVPITVVAEVLWYIEVRSKNQFFVDIFIGAVIALFLANVVSLPAVLRPGLEFSTKWFLRLGIIIYGLKFSYAALASAGLAYLAIILVAVIVAVGLSFALGHLLGVSPATSALIGTGTAICGVAAAMATAPSIKAKPEETAVALSTILLWGTLGMLLYPFLGHALGLSHAVYGAWTGASLHDLPQIVAAAQQGGGDTGLKYALLVKLIRVAFIVVLVLFMSIVFAVRGGRGEGEVRSGNIYLAALKKFPLFVAAFFVVVLINTFVKIPESIAGPLATYKASVSPVTVAGVCLTIAIVGICARVTRKVLATAGPRALALGLVTWVVQSGLVLLTAYVLLRTAT